MRAGTGQRLRWRAGFTLIEMLVAMALTLLLTIAALRMLRGTLLFVERSERNQQARGVARTSTALIALDMQPVTASLGGTSAVEAATTTSVTFRTPVAMGVLCSTSGISATISLLPADSVQFVGGVIAGAAYRSAAGEWQYLPGSTLAAVANVAACAAAGVNVDALAAGVGATGAPAGRIVTVTATIPLGTRPGTLVLLYRRIRYDFAASVANPGQRALWRRSLDAATGLSLQDVEVATPLTSAASFQFYSGTARVPQAVVPALNAIRGLEFILPSSSTSRARDNSAASVTTVRTSIFFRNRLD